MSVLIDHIALFLRALPHLPELVYPLIAFAALVNGMVAGRIWRNLQARRTGPARRAPDIRSAPGDPSPRLRSSPCRR
ncbi:hypothetical protein DZD18_08545 [Rhodobacteraceae bacterium W635]|uniref:hypothetical protein n=1 Tax=Nioella halotolerans TaxID=2303578 RepID=UPI000E3DB269|nr:hypothetical protein DZD18_08545 [Rhodobacteraceae bacterium W635]